MVTIKELELVRCLAESGSLTAASKQLHISQSAASQRLSSLQGRLDASLFDRQDGILQLTAAGERLLAAAIVVTDELQAAVFDIDELSKSPRKPIENCDAVLHLLPMAAFCHQEYAAGPSPAECRCHTRGDG